MNDARPTTRMLVKLRPQSSMGAAARRRLQPLYESPPASAFAATDQPAWFLADADAGGPTPWDGAHARIADQLGVSESDVLFVEPDVVHDAYIDCAEPAAPSAFEIGKNCAPVHVDSGHGKPPTPAEFAWHLGGAFTGLETARSAVTFTEPWTLVGHFDTGYLREHVTTPRNIVHELEHNFVDGGEGATAQDPNNFRLLFDNSGHGTGTIGILAGKGAFPSPHGPDVGAIPGVAVVPVRIADSVVLLRTSAFARALRYATEQRIDVVTMSMGGLPSRAWREAVDEAYLNGICIVAAAGNNSNGFPTRHIVYPARYGRVIAACGVMANGKPYAHLQGVKTLEGNFGPDSCMGSAIAAYTPNIPWARYECPELVRLNGEGTSSATPQVAAAVALWFEKYKGALPRSWQRVEAVRHALFKTAKKIHPKELGQGVLQAAAALGVQPTFGLAQTKSDRDSFAFLRVLTGLGIAEAPPREQMFNLELMQRWLLNPRLQALVPDPDAVSALDGQTRRHVMEALIEDEKASNALRKHIAARYPVLEGSPVPVPAMPAPIVAQSASACPSQPALTDPPYRRIRVYAVDPSLAGRLESAAVNEVTLHVRWEKDLDPGPSGEYLTIVDDDPISQQQYEPVDLNNPQLLAQDGWAPSEGNAQFHQQMVYAVAMKTLDHFERALGRPVLWRSDTAHVPRLKIHPHGLRHANAYYSPDEVALRFGFFDVSEDSTGDHVPGSRIYTCLSHDIIAHETTHAVLDGMHRRFNEPTNPDVLALHEAFADIVALMQHFTIPQILEHEIARVRGDIESETILGSLALQFGRAGGGRGALRQAIGTSKDGKWERLRPDPGEMQRRLTPHSRGAILVAAVFDAFIAIYNSRIADLLRIYTGGTGVLPSGSIHPDLVRRLAGEASKSAGHVLNMCIRALDYLPPVDVTFFEYLRALITADFDVVPDDRLNYRVAFVEAFRRRGILPVDLDPRVDAAQRSLSVETLRWQGIEESIAAPDLIPYYLDMARELRQFVFHCLYIRNRGELFAATRLQGDELKKKLKAAFGAALEFAIDLGIDPELDFDVEDLRPATRVSPDGRNVPQIVVVLTQSKPIPADPATGTPGHLFRGGSTLLVDLSVPMVKYRILKKIDKISRQERTAQFVREAAADPLRSLLLGAGMREPFAALHALADDGL